MSENKFNAERRRFFKLGLTAAASVIFLPALKIPGAFASDGPKAISEKDPTAMALGYKANASKVDVKKFPKRADADGKTQFCHNCMFYTADKKKMGKCQIFQNNLVAAEGWCNSWTKKPA